MNFHKIQFPIVRKSVKLYHRLYFLKAGALYGLWGQGVLHPLPAKPVPHAFSLYWQQKNGFFYLSCWWIETPAILRIAAGNEPLSVLYQSRTEGKRDKESGALRRFLSQSTISTDTFTPVRWA
jgi:hypothetical protein